jgi:hypothetical protein
MPKNRQAIILFFLFIISQTTYANTQLLPGYYLNKSGDSISCKIEYGDWRVTPRTINIEVNNEKRTLGADDIKGFGVFGYSEYKTVSVSYHTNPIEGTLLPEKYSDSSVTENTFLKVLIKGKYSLYEFQSIERKYFFIQKNDGAISELVYRVAAKDGEITEDKQYVNVLAGFFLQENLLDRYRPKVYNASYNSKISYLVSLLNGGSGGTGVQTNKTLKGEFQLALFAGAAINMFPSQLSGNFPAEGSLRSAGSAVAGISLLYIVPQRFQSLKFGLSLGYNHYHSSGGSKSDSVGDRADLNDYALTNYTTNLSLTNTVIFANIYAAYTINPLDKIKCFVKAGLSFSEGKKNLTAIDNYTTKTVGNRSGRDISGSGQGSEQVGSISDFLFNPLVGAGIETGRHRLEICYYHPWDAANHQYEVFRIGMTAIYYSYTILK